MSWIVGGLCTTTSNYLPVNWYKLSTKRMSRADAESSSNKRLFAIGAAALAVAGAGYVIYRSMNAKTAPSCPNGGCDSVQAAAVYEKGAARVQEAINHVHNGTGGDAGPVWRRQEPSNFELTVPDSAAGGVSLTAMPEPAPIVSRTQWATGFLEREAEQRRMYQPQIEVDGVDINAFTTGTITVKRPATQQSELVVPHDDDQSLALSAVKTPAEGILADEQADVLQELGLESPSQLESGIHQQALAHRKPKTLLQGYNLLQGEFEIAPAENVYRGAAGVLAPLHGKY